MEENTNAVSLSGRSVYEICLQGELGEQWLVWFEGFTVSEFDGRTRLCGEVADQAALHGLLRTVRDIGLPLLLIRRLDIVGDTAGEDMA